MPQVAPSDTKIGSKNIYYEGFKDFSLWLLSFLVCVVFVIAQVTELGSPLPRMARTWSWLSGYCALFETLSHWLFAPIIQ